MSVQARISGAWKTGQLYGRVSGSWKLLSASVRPSGSWKSATESALAVAVDLTSLFSAGSTFPVYTDPVTATASGGTSPYTYAWTFDSNNGVNIDSPSSASTTFHAAGAGQNYTAMARCTATDANGKTAFTLVSVEIEVDYPT